MFWKNVNPTARSLRLRLAVTAFVASGLIALVASAAVLFFLYRHLVNNVDEMLERLTGDLQEEYRELGGLTEAFIARIDDDVAEHDRRKTFILLKGGAGVADYATDMPVGYAQRLRRQIEKNRFSGRFYTERDGVRHKDYGAVRFASVALDDGGRIVVARDVTEMESFLILLTVALGGSVLLISGLTVTFGFLLGDRILRLGRLVEEKERAYRELSRLTDDIAHDLRTPLTRLAMAAETEVSGGHLREPLAAQVAGESRAMIDLISTMLEISQTDAKIDRTPRETLDLAAFVRRTGELYSAVAEDAALVLVVETPNRPVYFSGHKGKLQQLLGNLLENAIKFTPAGGRIRLVLESTPSAISLTVSDTGCGIAPEDLPHIFKRFWRADSSRHFPGNGLGLALAKAIVTSYGGSIRCESSPGQGTTFRVLFPLR